MDPPILQLTRRGLLRVYCVTEPRSNGYTEEQKMPNPTQQRTTKQTVTLTCDTLIALKTLAVKTGKTQGEIMTAAIEQYLRQHNTNK